MSKLMIKITTTIRENKGFILLVLLMFASRSSLADWYVVPSGSMQPTIAEGDRILVNKMAYRLEIPFTDITLMDIAQPKRGDIVVFKSKAADMRLIKRLIGLPGDKIAMQDNHLTINGKKLDYQYNQQTNQLSEQLDGFRHLVQFVGENPQADSFATVTVPQGHYLMLGDNRNNSADSRYYGFVPAEELQGRAHHIIVSLDPENYYLPRTERTASVLL